MNFSRHRIASVIIPIILVLVFFSLTEREFKRAPWYEEVFSNLVTPPQRAFSAAVSGVKNVWRHYFSLVGIRKEYDELILRLAELESMRVEMEEVKKENERLRALVSLGEDIKKDIVAARVIANEPRAEFKSITINRGSSDGVVSLSPVVGPKGLVGKVGKVNQNTSLVILITDPNSAVDAVVQRTRARGTVVGTVGATELRAGHYLSRLEYLDRTSGIAEGDIVVTSGLDGVFPAGLAIGTVHDVKLSRWGIFSESLVVPFEDMAELQDVAVIK